MGTKGELLVSVVQLLVYLPVRPLFERVVGGVGDVDPSFAAGPGRGSQAAIDVCCTQFSAALRLRQKGEEP